MKTLPARNPLSDAPVFRKDSQASKLRGEDPDYRYEYFSTDPTHPSYIGKKLEEHEIGNDEVGYLTVGAWDVCSKTVDPRVAQMAPREDQGKGTDTTIKLGTQRLCRIHKSEYKKYKDVEDAKRKAERTSLNQKSPDGSTRAVFRTDSGNEVGLPKVF